MRPQVLQAGGLGHALKGLPLDKLPVYITPGSCGLGTLSMFLNTYKSAGFDTAGLGAAFSTTRSARP